MLGITEADAVVLAATVAAVPAAISAVFAFRANHNVKTGNGQTAGRYMVQTAIAIKDVQSQQLALRDAQEAQFTLLLEHTEQDAKNFEALRKDQRAVRAAVSRLENQRG